MIAPTQIRKPANWQDFEKLCKKLWGEIWQCSDTIQRHGRQGQKQCGVDVYGIPKGEKNYYGIQCKGKDEALHTQLTQTEIDEEIGKALTFTPKLSRLIFATTANKDANIEGYIRSKNLEHIQKGLFEVYLSSWEDIVDLLEDNCDTYNWYVNNCQYKDVSDVAVTFNGKEECIIYPEYYRKIRRTEVGLEDKASTILSDTALRPLIESFRESLVLPYSRSKHDYRWCKIYVDIENVGNTTLDDYKLYIEFGDDRISKVDAGFHYENSMLISDAVKAQVNAAIDKERNVFEIEGNGILYEPQKPLVKSDLSSFKFSVKPKDNIDIIPLFWRFVSRTFQKRGELKIIVSPKYEDIPIIRKVANASELIDDKIESIEPKIV